jgi:protein-disulfide isomerase
MMGQENRGATLAVPVGERDHAQGAANAPLTLVEYGDYQCSYCGQAYAVVKQLQQEMGDHLRFVFREFPLAQAHPHAEHAAETAEAAGAQGKFWEMHDTLYEHQQALDDANLEQYAGSVGLDMGRFDREMRAQTYLERVREDFMGGSESGVEGTPTFFINGRRHDGSFDLDTLRAALRAQG